MAALPELPPALASTPLAIWFVLTAAAEGAVVTIVLAVHGGISLLVGAADALAQTPVTAVPAAAASRTAAEVAARG
ncbi:hypothetical protein O1611_g1532 [Lasiodiplodia mahajangana]|uniref:Uncharacterized protein n=1 Tax=Lasiodiplodia mahajangana TaxID=1108764 RepID=A0ACC2JX52_9PEZI|nr:hypothetical protein O1611_g1532 [Lasiodiplodia mahajangana]